MGLLYLASACEAPDPPDQMHGVAVVQQVDGSFQRIEKANKPLEGPARLYYPSGKLQALLNFQHDSLEGRQIWFHPAGYLETTERRHRGQLHGRKYIFYPSGAVQSLRTMRHGLRVGDYYEYYAQPRNQLHIHAQFALVQGREWDNGYIAYDSLGHLQSGRGFLQVKANADTVRLGQTLTLRLRVLFPKENHVLASIFGYDSLYRLVHPTVEIVVLGAEHVVTANITPQRRGEAEVRGYVADFKSAVPVSKTQRQVGLDVQELRMYFAYPYYVY